MNNILSYYPKIEIINISNLTEGDAYFIFINILTYIIIFCTMQNKNLFNDRYINISLLLSTFCVLGNVYKISGYMNKFCMFLTISFQILSLILFIHIRDEEKKHYQVFKSIIVFILGFILICILYFISVEYMYFIVGILHLIVQYYSVIAMNHKIKAINNIKDIYGISLTISFIITSIVTNILILNSIIFQERLPTIYNLQYNVSTFLVMLFSTLYCIEMSTWYNDTAVDELNVEQCLSLIVGETLATFNLWYASTLTKLWYRVHS